MEYTNSELRLMRPLVTKVTETSDYIITDSV
jgi:hypothetical protein